MIQRNLFMKQKHTTDLENELMVSGVGGGRMGRRDREFGIDMSIML